MSIITLVPSVLQWARKRANLDKSTLARKVLGPDGTAEDVTKWERTGELTFHRAELLAEKTYTPFGYLFLNEPPEEQLPINDFRTMGNLAVQNPSPELLDTIYQCQQRQEWYRRYLKSLGAEPLKFIGSQNTEYPIRAAEDIRNQFNVGPRLSQRAKTWKENLAHHFEAVESSGILVMRNGIVGNNTSRSLSTDEFRGFALSDDYAPLIFINTHDAIAAQLFTLIHELVHVFVGESAVSNPKKTYVNGGEIERYCNSVAAEVLVPMRNFELDWRTSNDQVSEIKRIASRYKVSTLVIARRARDCGLLTQSQFNNFYEQETIRYFAQQNRKSEDSGGGNFHATLSARAGNRFSRAILASTFEGKSTYKEAFQLLGINNSGTFRSFAKDRYGYELG